MISGRFPREQQEIKFPDGANYNSLTARTKDGLRIEMDVPRVQGVVLNWGEEKLVRDELESCCSAAAYANEDTPSR